MPKGPVFYKEPSSDEEEDDEEEQKRIAENPNLDFNSILDGMGGAGFGFSSGLSSEEEKKGPAMDGLKVFRPNLTGSQHFREDSMSIATKDPEAAPDDLELSNKFEAHLADPNVKPV